MNLNGGDFNSQIGLQSWSYELPVERRKPAPQPYVLLPQPPPAGLSAFIGRKREIRIVENNLFIRSHLLDHPQKRNAQEIRDHGSSPRQ